MCKLTKDRERAIRDLGEALRQVSDGDFPTYWDTSCGICSNVLSHLFEYDQDDLTIDTIYSLVRSLMARHPDYTGCGAYPIPGSPDALHGLVNIERITGRQALAWDSYARGDNLYTGTYGKTRREWAGWIADKLEEMLNA